MQSPTSEPDTPLRLFCALDFPDRVRAGLEAWGVGALSDPVLRPVPAENLHMTLCFLGWTAPERVEEAIEVMTAVRPRAVPVRFRLDPVAKPPRRPSLFAIEVEAPVATELAGEVGAAYRELGLAEDEKRPFWPHVTVARVRPEQRKGGQGRRRPQRVQTPPGPLPAGLGGEFLAVRLCLYRSMMRRDGSQYVPLSNVDLEVN